MSGYGLKRFNLREAIAKARKRKMQPRKVAPGKVPDSKPTRYQPPSRNGRGKA